jgi:hypothetical protein
MKDLAAIAKNLYSVRREIKRLQGDEEKYKKMILKLYEDPILVKTLDGRKTMEVVTDEVNVLKDNETISQKIGAQKFYQLAKIGQGDLKNFCEEEGFKFKWFIKKKAEGATKIIFT